MDRLMIIIGVLALVFAIFGCQPQQTQYINNGWSMRAADKVRQQEMQDSYDETYVANFKLNEEIYYGTGKNEQIDVIPVWEKSYAVEDLQDDSQMQ